jgi:carbamate kinase
MRETLVIALGGNAITRPGERGTIPQQFAHTAETLEHLVPLFRSDRRIVITHGNGPQIGNILIRSEEGERRVPPLPLDTCVSDSQGGMGYMIQRVADQIFRREDIRRECATVITQVVVDRNDPDFDHPSKPVGSFHTAEELEKLKVEKPHWRMKEIEPGRWRRVVPSPRPLDILEKDSIAAMLEAGVVVIACGGGGIPVAWDGERLVGVEGVIDKDMASCLLAKQIRAHRLIIVTSVDKVAIAYHKPEQQWLANMTLDSAQHYLQAGEFPAGSMGPKIESAIDFIKNGGEECIITSTEKVAEAVEGHDGTHIVAAWGNRTLAFNAP